MVVGAEVSETEYADPDERVKRRAYLSACLVGIPIDVLGWFLAEDVALARAYLAIAGVLAFIAILTGSRLPLQRVERLAFPIITGAFLWRSGVVALLTDDVADEFGELITSVVMLCVVYLLAFLFYPRVAAFVISIGVLLASAAIVGVGLLRVGVADLPHSGMPLYKAFTMQAVFVALLYILAVTQERMIASQARAKALDEIASTDALTGAFNRRHLVAVLEQHVADAARSERELSVLLFDVDHFKRINDVHGHDVGDRVLCHLVNTLQGVLREADTFGRWGGEEFLVVAPGADIDDALELANRCRRALASAPAPGAGEVKVSCGVASWRPAQHWEAVVRAADAALYAAKAAGRDQAVADRADANRARSQVPVQ